MLSSGIPRVSEYQELDKEPEFTRLLDYSRRFRAEVEARDVFSRLYGLKWVEAGAQGPHKVQRGYLPRRTYSAHWIADPGLRSAIGRFLVGERHAIEEEMAELSARSPFRRPEGGGDGGGG